MQDAEGAVAVADAVGDDPHRREVVDLVELLALLVHLLPDRIEVLGAAPDLRLDPDLGEFPLEDRDDVVDVGLALEPPLGHAPLEVHVGVRVEAPERQVLQLGLDVRHSEPVRERRVDVERLLTDLARAVPGEVVQGAHVVEAVGELDHEHAQVAGHGDEHLAEVLRLPFLARRERELADLGDAVD